MIPQARPSRRQLIHRIVTLIALIIVAVVGWAVAGYLPESMQNFVRIVATGCGVAALFNGLISLLLLALNVRLQVFSIAGAVIRESLHTKLAAALLVLMVLIIAALPFIVGQTDRLQYRIQQFLSYSLMLTTFLLALLTIFLACQTLSNEIRDKQIFTVMTKPVNRGAYLLGKWLGIVMLNAVLLTVAGVSIYGFVMFYLVPQPARDQLDRIAIHEQVVTARVAAEPSPPPGLANEVRQRLQRLVDEQSTSFIEDRGGLAVMEDEIRQQVLTEWRSLGPYGRTRYQSIFIFPDMARAKQMGLSVQLEFKINASGSVEDQHTRIWWGANGRMIGEPKQVPVNIKQTELIPVEWIDEDGRLELLAVNLNPEASISFPAKDGMQLLYTVDTFGPNFARGLVMIWLKLAFLAALGLATASFLGFPVAVLLSLMIFAGASGSQFILESLQYFARPGEDGQVDLMSQMLKWVATGFIVPLEQYGAYRPVPRLHDGLYISWSALLGCALWIGVVWTGVAGVTAWIIFQRRELARVQV